MQTLKPSLARDVYVGSRDFEAFDDKSYSVVLNERM